MGIHDNLAKSLKLGSYERVCHVIGQPSSQFISSVGQYSIALNVIALD
jgi:hypothetical protein